MKLQDIYHNLKQDLQAIERELKNTVRTDHDQLNRAALHLLKAGGKRMRPVFVLLSGRLGRYDFERLKKVAVSLELIHMATLVHDDVIDDASTRRGQPTVKAKWNNRIAMYTGDYLLARALMIASSISTPHVHQVLSRAITQMCRGEVEQIRHFYNWNQTLLCYLHRIKRKTALLMAVSCQLGGMVSDAGTETIRRLRLYGYFVGMAFQITDDVLDIVGDEKELGKPAGSDLRQGNVTLPVIYALRCGPSETREAIIQYLASSGDSVDLHRVLDRVKEAGGIDYAQALSRRYLDKALHILESLPEGEARESLRMIAEFIDRRSY